MQYHLPMCGRYTYTGNPNHVTTRLGIESIPSKPRYNMAPGQQAVIIRALEGERPALDKLQWGLIPFWAKDPSMGFKTINARSEKVESTASFRAPLRYRRCLVLMNSFFEWEKSGRKKQPWRFLMKDESTFAVAGLWDHWNRPDGAVLETFTILTTLANSLVGDIHDRMPVICPPEAWETWLDQKVQMPASVHPFLAPYPAEAMKVHPVSDRVNSALNDDPACIQPIAPPPQQQDLFSL